MFADDTIIADLKIKLHEYQKTVLPPHLWLEVQGTLAVSCMTHSNQMINKM